MKLLKMANNVQDSVILVNLLLPIFSFLYSLKTSVSLIIPKKLGFLMFNLFKAYKKGNLERNVFKL